MNKFASLIAKIASYHQAAQENKVLGPYYNGNQQRQIVIVISPEGKRKTLSYPKYLYMKDKGMDLFQDFDLTIDHKNFDHSDNRMENLRAIPRDEHSADDTRRVKLVKLKCPTCKKKFERSPRLLRDKAKKGCKGPFCSKSCSSKFFRNEKFRDKIDELQVQDFAKSRYYRRKKVEAFIQYLLIKY